MSKSSERKVGIIMNGITGRMGMNQHLMRSIVEIIKQGGVTLSDKSRIMPVPVLVGRNSEKLESLASSTGIAAWTTDLESVLRDPSYEVYFDAQTTLRRFEDVSRAISAGKHIYCEKPTAVNADDAYQLYAAAQKKKVKHGVVQDKLWLPGLIKLQSLVKNGFFGEILSLKGEFGYWVFEGDRIPSQRPSWNYKKDEGGGIIVDMLCHWRYILDRIFGNVQSVSCLGATHIKQRWDEDGKPYTCTADDAAYATFELDGGIIAHFNSSWATRVRRDDLFTLQVDGTNGSAVAGLRSCVIQPYDATPRPTWNPDLEQPIVFYDKWKPVPSAEHYDNAFKSQWELFLKHIVANEPFPWDLLEGAKGVQLAEKGIESWQQKCWVGIPELHAISC